ncbi:hypothetical protein HPB49_017012 [Dermacentor silvarum]|uniref:Uncharacterized protein n=1 Tax=Dermacentor silvarum TaxID=543639 RepID=A0ACB8DQH9_DERSI|nr:hypothetical protein HPB49_017012 [Dermacentor silvarum]
MNDRLLEMGIYNTASELFQAHYMNQVIRLARTKAGRTTLEALGINPPTHVARKRSLPPEWQQDIITRPLPRNMHPVHHENRRTARAKAYDKYSDHAGAFFVDAAGPLHNRSTATVVHRGQVVDCISATGMDITAMEEAGIALAMRNPRATFVLTDSQAAYRNFARGQVGHLAHSILQQAAANRQEGQWKQLLWVPGHAGVRGNEIAHASARELLHRGSADSSTAQLLADQDDPQPLLSYSDILQHLRLSRRTLPPPDPKLDKATQARRQRATRARPFQMTPAGLALQACQASDNACRIRAMRV